MIRHVLWSELGKESGSERNWETEQRLWKA